MNTWIRNLLILLWTWKAPIKQTVSMNIKVRNFVKNMKQEKMYLS